MTDRDAVDIQRLLDKQAIADTIAYYARGVDRGDWDLLQSTYHPDAFDDHVEYKGDIPGLIKWLKERFQEVDNSTHFLGNSLVEFHSESVALVETYFISHRVISNPTPVAAVPEGAICRQSWGRYVDRFEKRAGLWKVARRTVVIDSRVMSPGGLVNHTSSPNRGFRNLMDPLYQIRASLEQSEA